MVCIILLPISDSCIYNYHNNIVITNSYLQVILWVNSFLAPLCQVAAELF